jgi:hypothetical protein
MSRMFYAAVVIIGLTANSNALGQATTAPNNSSDNSVNPQSRPVLGAASSGSGNLGANAGSSTIGAGSAYHDHTGTGGSKEGAVGTEAPATTVHSTTGANSPSDVNQ